MQKENNKKLSDIIPVGLNRCIDHANDFIDATRYCMNDIILTNKYADTVGKMEVKIGIDIPGMIDRVIYNDPATIIIWKDGTKTVVKRSEDDIWDPEKGFCMAVIKKLYGHTSFIKDFMEPENEMPILTVEEACENLKNFGKKLNDVLGKGGKK